MLVVMLIATGAIGIAAAAGGIVAPPATRCIQAGRVGPRPARSAFPQTGE